MSFPRYEKYKDSGVEWLGEVPEGWEVTPVKNVAKVVNGYPFDSKLFAAEGGYPLVRIRDINSNESETRYVGDFVEQAAITSDDVLIGMDGDFNVGRWRGKGKALLNQRMCCVRGQSDLLTRLLEFSLPIPLKAINDVTYSTTVKHLSASQVEKTRIALPPKKTEQRTIAAFLDHETGKIDALVAEQEKLIGLLKEKRQALITHAVTKGLDPNVKMKDSGVEWIGQVPEHWKIAQIKRISALNPRESTLSEEKDSLCTFLPMEKLRTNAVTLDETRPIHEVYGGYSYFCDGDILIAKVTPCFENGNIAVANGLVNGIGFGSTEINVLRVNGKGHNRFLYYRLQEEQFRTIAKSEMRGTGGLKRVPTELFESFTIGLPDTDEQATIAAFLDHETGKIDTLIEAAQRAIELMKERRTALISAAVTGKIDVRGYCPAEEEEGA